MTTQPTFVAKTATTEDQNPDETLSDTETICLDISEASGSTTNEENNESNTGNSESLTLSPLSIGGIIAIVVCFALVTISAAKTKSAYTPGNRDWEDDRDAALFTGGLAMVLFLLAVPLQFLVLTKYLKAKKAQGLDGKKPGQGLGVASWFLFASSAIFGICLIILGNDENSDVYISPYCIIGTGCCGFASWLLMFFRSEKARKSSGLRCDRSHTADSV